MFGTGAVEAIAALGDHLKGPHVGRRGWRRSARLSVDWPLNH